jgi:hypothetical protein
MKKIFFITIVILGILSTECFSQKGKGNFVKNDKESGKDSLEYSLIIIDPGFEFWLATQHPVNFYSQSYYESKNRLDVTIWNQRFTSTIDNELYDNYIDYNPGIDYGIDLNYKLYYYFRYFEIKNNVILYPRPVDWVNVLIFSM